MAMEKINIVLADDDEDDRALFELAVNELKVPHQFDMCKNGQELIDYFRQPETRLPDILFLDLNMPNLSGVETLKEIRKDPGLRGITVAIYSTSSSERDIEATFLEGANIYINKPSDFETLKKIIKKVVTIDWQYHTSILNRDNFLFRF
ncbi:response regulator [Winogradskyella schleiferi]|uniref:response regulator n=1 Tax=Winogradskyella schleiferi TaxID=2686078 RepID=UPI0015BF0888|nr:response regulator [Winogradskyella schleiferi]